MANRRRVGWRRKNYDRPALGFLHPFQCDFTQIDEDSVAELFYTSGSSDRPRA